jgi:hypothetical protein
VERAGSSERKGWVLGRPEKAAKRLGGKRKSFLFSKHFINSKLF